MFLVFVQSTVREIGVIEINVGTNVRLQANLSTSQSVPYVVWPKSGSALYLLVVELTEKSSGPFHSSHPAPITKFHTYRDIQLPDSHLKLM